jgi:hypothetical protein
MFVEINIKTMSPMPTDIGTSRGLAEQLYNLLMAEIEQDLLLENIPTLDAKYAGETEGEKATRMKRYEEAYRAFDRSFSAFMGDIYSHVRGSRRSALEEQETEAQTQEQKALSSLEKAFR